MSITTKTVAFTWDITFTLELKHSHFLHLHFNINPIASYHPYFIFRFIYFLYFFWILKYEATTPRISTISAKVMNTKIDESSMQNNTKTHASSNIQAAAIHKFRLQDCVFLRHLQLVFCKNWRNILLLLRTFTLIIRKIKVGMLQIINFISIILPIYFLLKVCINDQWQWNFFLLEASLFSIIQSASTMFAHKKTVSFPEDRKLTVCFFFIIIFLIFDKSVLSAYQLHLITCNQSLW